MFIAVSPVSKTHKILNKNVLWVELKAQSLPFRSSQSSREDRNRKIHSQGNVESAMTESCGSEKGAQLLPNPGWTIGSFLEEVRISLKITEQFAR